MLSHDELDRMREEQEADERWRKYSRHVVADMVEVCAVCGMVRDKERLMRCRWCDDAYVCKSELCAHQHSADVHRDVAFWSW